MGAQSLKVLPQGPFGDAVNQFVAKDDKHAMELFVSEHLTGQVKQLLDLESDDEDLNTAMEIYRTRVEQQMAGGPGKTGLTGFGAEKKRVLKPKPDTWDSDFDGEWENEPGAWTYEDAGHQPDLTTTQQASRSSRRQMAPSDGEENSVSLPKKRSTATRGSKASVAKTAEKKAPGRKTPAAKGRGRKAVEEMSDEDEEHDDDADVVMESDEEPPPSPPRKATARGRRPAVAKGAPTTTTKSATGRPGTKTKQMKLDFSQKSTGGTQRAVEISDDEISDDEAFAPAPISSRTRRR